jgi:DNA modification methylase
MAGKKKLQGRGRKPRDLAYATNLGHMFLNRAEDGLETLLAKGYQNSIQLIFTSPPFPLLRKKKYGNYQGKEYLDWIASFGERFRELLQPKGSLVIEIGNTWERGSPTMSTLPMEALMALKEAGGFHLCQEIICHNPARLPSPAQWVNVERIRLKDSFTRLWWLSKTERPKADNRNVLQSYTPAMKKIIAGGRYNSGTRPSEHNVGKKSFSKDNGGSIMPSVLSFSNTESGSPYFEYCREIGLKTHPARMPKKLAEFFIKFLSDKGDIVLDPFAGSNTTGAAAEELSRQWVSIEQDPAYIAGSIGRFGEIAYRRDL